MCELRKRAQRWAARLWSDTAATTATEYAVMMALIIIVSMAVIASMGNRLYDIYDVIDTAIPQN
jgi:Flp pilus assembly pilin Flp